MKAIDILKEYSPCLSAVEWLGDKSLKEAWETCDRGDWMLWAYKRLYPDNLREITIAKGHIANTVRTLMKDKRSLAAVDAAINFGNGLIGIDELAAYAADAYAAAYDAADADAAAYAAADDADAADAAAAAAAYAAYAAADAADAADAYSVARRESLLESANICRKYLTIGE